MTGYLVDHATPDQVAAELATYGPVAEVLRELAASSIRTTATADVVERATALLREARDLLDSDLGPASYGTRFAADGTSRDWGNACTGERNPVAPPTRIDHTPELTSSDFVLGPQYEGPPGLVHGGVIAMILDQVLGSCAVLSGKPGLTASLEVSYRRPTPLGRLRSEAHIERTEGHKTWVTGHISDPDGNVTATARALFILPRALRDQVDDAGRPLALED